MNARSLPTTPSYLDGVTLAVNAIRDASLVIDCASCGDDRVGKVGISHDLMSSLTHADGQHRVQYSDLGANDYVMGTQGKLLGSVRRMAAARGSALVLVVQSSAVQLMGIDAEPLTELLEAELGVPVMVVGGGPSTKDWLDGYSAALRVLAARIAPPLAAPRLDAVAIVGYLMDRLELDHTANLAELTRMLSALKLSVVGRWLDGGSWGALGTVAHAESILALPHGREAALDLAGRLHCRSLDVGLPIGLEGSCRWVRRVALHHDKEREAEALISRELDALVPRFEWVVRRTLAGRSVAIAGEPAAAVGLAAFARELGMQTPLVALHSRKQRAVEIAREALGSECNDTHVLVDPDVVDLENRFRDLAGRGELDLILGTGKVRDAARTLAVPFLELGYPSHVRHALFEAPSLGFRGSAWLVDMMANLLREHDYMRG